MKILMINQFPLTGGGSGFYTKNVAKSLVELGHEVYIIIPENKTKIEKIDGVKIRPVFFKRREKIDGQLPFNFGCFTTHPRSSITFNKYTDDQLEMYINAFKNAIEDAIKEFKPDIIHSGHIWILSNIASKYNIPTIITSHGTDIIGHNMWDKFHKYSNEAIERCSKVITISDSNKEDVLTAFPHAKGKVIQLRNGYDQNIFERREYNKKEVLREIGIDKDYKSIVLFSGRLVEIKGVDVLLKAAKRYEDGNILTIIAGGGMLLEPLEEQAKELGLKDVVFLGNQKQEKLSILYNIADVLAVPSRIEGFGLVAVEALACGTPVVATNQGGLPEFINEKVGALVEVEDDSALEKEISKIVSGEKIFNKEELANYAKNNYAQSLVIDKVVETYKSCL